MILLLTLIILLIAILVASNAWILRTRTGDRELIERYVATQVRRLVEIRRRLLRPRDGGLISGPSRWTRVFVVVAERQGGTQETLTLAIDPWRQPATVVRFE